MIFRGCSSNVSGCSADVPGCSGDVPGVPGCSMAVPVMFQRAAISRTSWKISLPIQAKLVAVAAIYKMDTTPGL